MVELEQTLDLRVIPLSEGSIHVESYEDSVVINTVKDIRLNSIMLPLQNLHALHQWVSYELRIRE